MTRSEAIKAVNEGYKVTHTYFTNEEYVGLFNGILHDENNIPLPSEFWELRRGHGWDDGWEIKE